MNPMTDILAVKDLNKSFGKLDVITDLSFEVKKGEILGVIGPNGAGKTTLFNLLTGVLKPDSGSIKFQDRPITNEPLAKRCHMGIGRTYQIPQPFDKMTVFENFLVAAVHGGKMSEKTARGKVNQTLEMVGLDSVRNQMAGSLPLLDRKALELGRALSTQPSLILFDEIAGGLTEAETEEILKIAKTIQAEGMTIIWIEHIMMMMSEGVDRLLVLAEGKKLFCGDPAEAMKSKEVLVSYLGEDD